jgi:hypothetical protein
MRLAVTPLVSTMRRDSRNIVRNRNEKTRASF